MTHAILCLWFEGTAEEAANFYAATFPDSAVTGVFLAPSDYPSGKAGDVLTVTFTVAGIPCLGLNGGPAFRQSESLSFQIATEDQAEQEGAAALHVIQPGGDTVHDDLHRRADEINHC